MTRSWRKVERFLLRLLGRGVQSEEDKMVGEKEGNFFLKQLYNELELRGHVDFSSKLIWKYFAPPTWE